MKTYIKTLGLTALLSLASTQVHAISLSLTPDFQSVTVGDTASVDIVVDGLGSGVPLSLGGWSADFLFDPALISLTGITFGTGLDAGLFGSFQDDSLSLPGFGLISLFEASLEPDFLLDIHQGSSFVLATFDFEALAPTPGAPVLWTGAVLSDTIGDTISPSSPPADAFIEITPGSSMPDAGSTFALLGLGLGGLVIGKKVRTKRR